MEIYTVEIYKSIERHLHLKKKTDLWQNFRNNFYVIMSYCIIQTIEIFFFFPDTFLYHKKHRFWKPLFYHILVGKPNGPLQSAATLKFLR